METIVTLVDAEMTTVVVDLVVTCRRLLITIIHTNDGMAAVEVEVDGSAITAVVKHPRTTVEVIVVPTMLTRTDARTVVGTTVTAPGVVRLATGHRGMQAYAVFFDSLTSAFRFPRL